MSYKSLLFYLMVLSVGVASCWNSKGKKIPDVSDINVDVDIKHFNQQLFSVDTNDIKVGISELKSDYPAFFNLYFKYVLPFSKNDVFDEYFYSNVQGFLTDRRIRKLVDTTAIVFNNFEPIEKDLEQAFKFYKYYFPNKNLPEVYTLISEFGFGTFVFPIEKNKDGLGIGLDMFLGNDYPYWEMAKDNPSFSLYISRTFDKQHLVKKAMDAIIEDLVGDDYGNKLIDKMIHNGKKMYLSELFLPYEPDSVKMEYTTQQTAWVKNNESQIWAHLIKEKLLYETSTRRYQKLIDHSPSSPGMPPEAPGRTANFIGMKIIEAFMKNNPDTSLEELVNIKNAQIIFDKSEYRPL